MAFEHRAFCFDFRAFEAELAPLLYRALSDEDAEAIRDFVERNREALTDPYEGEPLSEEWEEMLEARDVQAYGDFALTKYYSPKEDIGLGTEWTSVGDRLRGTGSGLDGTLLGIPFGPPVKQFDPGRMGSYFQSPEMVAEHLRRLEKEPLDSDIDRAKSVLRAAQEVGIGLYVTF